MDTPPADLSACPDEDIRNYSQSFSECGRQKVRGAPSIVPVPAAADGSIDLLNTVLEAHYGGGAHLIYAESGFRHFDRTHWMPLSDKELGRNVLAQLLASGNPSGRRVRAQVQESIDLLTMKQATAPNRLLLDDPPPVIHVTNGELWIGADGGVELRPHDPASGLNHCLDVHYDPAAVCPRFDRAIAEIFSTSKDPAALEAIWDEVTGYVLQPARPDARIVVGWGQGSDGKTALVNLLTQLIGRDRVAATPVKQLASNRFMLSHLAEKALYLDDDVTIGTVLPDGVLKTISEAKILTGEPKHRAAFEFRVRAFPLLLCNAVPRVHDLSHGFRRRLAVIPFERCFSETEADRTVFADIWTTERCGVLNRAMAGLRRVINRGWKFDLPDVVIEATDAWWRAATSESGSTMDTVAHRRVQPAPPAQFVARKPNLPLREHCTPTPPAHFNQHVSVSVATPDHGGSSSVKVEAGATAVTVCVRNTSSDRRLLDPQANRTGR